MVVSDADARAAFPYVCECVCARMCGGWSHVTDRIMTLQRNCVIVNFALIIIVNTLFIFSFLFTN